MGEQQHVKFPQEVIDEYAALGVDLQALFSAGHLGTRMGVQITQASPERVVGAMLHAGSSKLAVGVDLNCTHHRGARSGLVTGVATPVHRGRTTATYEIVISDEEGRRVCTARLTCLLRDVNPGDGEHVRAAR